jgi:hypothetical protein
MLAQQIVTTGAPMPNTRAHRRFTASELRGLRTARVKAGPEVSVIDLSRGGVLFETAAELKPDSTIVLEFSGTTGTFQVPSRVLRCRSVATLDNSVRSSGACSFEQPLPVEDLVNAPLDRTPAASGARLRGSLAGWQPLVGKYRDGRVVNGYTNDFDPMKPYLHLSPTPDADDAQFVTMIQLDALFFVGDTPSTPERGAVHDEADLRARGRKVALALPNGKELIGFTLDYNRDGSGFFVVPDDSRFGATRVFVTQSGIRNIRFL